MDNKSVAWMEDLPQELWPVIAKHVTATIDVLRFRSTCKSWRSLLPPPPSPSPSLFPPQLIIPLGQFRLFQTKIYRLQPSSSLPHEDPSNSISSLSSKGWIIKVRDSKPLPLRLLDPFTNYRVSLPGTSPKVLNLLNFRVVELIEAYTLYVRKQGLFHAELVEVEGEHVFVPVPDVRKVVLFPSFRMVFVLYQNGKLAVSQIGDENWTFIDDRNVQHYDDIILHKGQLYVVDRYWGTILWADCSSLKLVQFSHGLCTSGRKKQLVECGGCLYVVDMYIIGDPDNNRGMFSEVVDIKVYKLDEEWGRWLDVKNLGDVLFVLGKDSNFSLSAQDYYGCEGNCIYFYSESRVWGFCLENSKFRTANLFWPCPTLFHPKFNL